MNQTVLRHDSKIASLMNERVSEFQAPSECMLNFVTKQGIFNKKILMKGGD